MTKTEFLEGLRDGLSGEVEPRVIQESIEYYSRYITESMETGKTEEQVFEELGPVRLIVKSIIDANRGVGRQEEIHYQQEQERTKSQSGFSLRSWYGKLLLVLFAVLLVVVLIALIIIIVMAAWYLLPIIVIIAIVLILARIFLGKDQ